MDYTSIELKSEKNTDCLKEITARQSRGGYVKYIATREGVEKLDDSQKFAPVTAKQRQLIQCLLKDFPGDARGKP